MIQVKRGDKEFQEIVDEMVIDLVRQDMDEAGEGARRKAEKEHQARNYTTSNRGPVARWT